MALDLSFKQVCDLIKKGQKDNHDLIDAVDKLWGLTLVCSPLLMGPAAVVILPTITVKNEIVRLGKTVFEAISKKKDDDYMARQQRMQLAYALICFTAFFEAVDGQIPEGLRRRIGFRKEEKIALANGARGKDRCSPETCAQDPASLSGTVTVHGNLADGGHG